MSGFMFAIGACAGCRFLFSFNPELVPSLTINGRREREAFEAGRMSERASWLMIGAGAGLFVSGIIFVWFA